MKVTFIMLLYNCEMQSTDGESKSQIPDVELFDVYIANKLH